MNDDSALPGSGRDYELDACFLGPYAENDELLEKLLLEFLRDHIYWRRNFHPEDPPAIPTVSSLHPDYLACQARMRRELHQLSAALKRSVPFHSPRYLGHMVSDLLIPGLVAQILTLPYNPNNVTEESAPITVDLELKVGLQLARMIGYPHDPTQANCAMGHLTSGGTIANYQALRLALALKAFPVALRAAGVPDLELPDNDWQAFNLPADQSISLLENWQTWLDAQSSRDRAHWQTRLQSQRVEQLGLVDFFDAHPELSMPLVLAPVTAHYSWSKGLKMLGMGRNQLRLLPTQGMRLDPQSLYHTLETSVRERQSILACVAILGSTEYGTIDPVDEVLHAREHVRGQGLDFNIHVDAAWGGYLTTMFRREDGELLAYEEVVSDCNTFPSMDVYRAFSALCHTDSVTVDPHKLGYIPFGAGAFVCRDHRAMALLAERADYVFHRTTERNYFARYRNLGQYIPEGSKPGAAAAAVYVTHRVLPLDHANFGRIPRATVQAAKAFHERAILFSKEVADHIHVIVPFTPDTNLVCLAINPRGNESIAGANTYVRELYEQLRADPMHPVQVRKFFGSITSLQPRMLGPADTTRILDALHLDASTLGDDEDSDSLLILRHTLMNPYLIDQENDISYIDLYFDFLIQRVHEQSRA